MINARLDVPPILRGGGRYHISTHRKTIQNSCETQTEGSLSEQYQQLCDVGALYSRIAAFSTLDCNVQLWVNIGNGEAHSEGTVSAMTLEVFAAAKAAVDQINALLKALPKAYDRQSKFSCTIIYAQTTELTDIKRARYESLPLREWGLCTTHNRKGSTDSP